MKGCTGKNVCNHCNISKFMVVNSLQVHARVCGVCVVCVCVCVCVSKAVRPSGDDFVNEQN